MAISNHDTVRQMTACPVAYYSLCAWRFQKRAIFQVCLAGVFTGTTVLRKKNLRVLASIWTIIEALFRDELEKLVAIGVLQFVNYLSDPTIDSFATREMMGNIQLTGQSFCNNHSLFLQRYEDCFNRKTLKKILFERERRPKSYIVKFTIIFIVSFELSILNDFVKR